MTERFSPRRIDEVVLVTDDISQLVRTLRDVFHHEDWTRQTKYSGSGSVLWHEALHVMSGGKAFRMNTLTHLSTT